MATSCMVTVPMEDGTLKSVYGSADGYFGGVQQPCGVGFILENNYNSIEKARALVGKGSFMELAPTIEDSFFFSDEGDDEPVNEKVFGTLDDAIKGNIGMLYHYIFIDGVWNFVKEDGTVAPLKEPLDEGRNFYEN